MKSKCIISLIVILLLPAGLLAQVRVQKPNDFTIELGGRCILYALSYQRMFGEMAALEVGASMIGGATVETSASVIFLSGGGRVYLMRGNATPCIAAGLVFVTAGTSAGPFSATGSGVYIYATPGFEFRMQGGFVFRGGVNLLIKDGVFVWPGIALGIAF
jgi:hypothetical protein